MNSTSTHAYKAVTCNACNVCTPLGACLAFRGIEGAIPYLHGSQGCSTYIRRYLIGHFREPLDIASSNFGERTAIYGGADNFQQGLNNVIRQYRPALVGVATTCLSETIGDDLSMYLHEFLAAHREENLPEIVTVSTPSYQGTHADGFHRAVLATTRKLAGPATHERLVNVLPGMVSPADLRYLKEIVTDFDMIPTCLPDYSDTLDGGIWQEYQRIPSGGTSLGSIRRMGGAAATLEWSTSLSEADSAAAWLHSQFGVPRIRMTMPIGIAATDLLFSQLAQLSGRVIPPAHQAERERLIDAYIDGHKYIQGRKVVVYGDIDFVIAMAAFLGEIGLVPVLCASGARQQDLAQQIRRYAPDVPSDVTVLCDTDFSAITAHEATRTAQLMIGSSKGYTLSRQLKLPLLRVGFPIHDRIGASRLLHVGYRGTQQLFDRIVNTLIAMEQDQNPVGYLNY